MSPESYQTTTHLKIENESWFVELERSWTREVCYICSFCVNSDHFFVNCQSRVWRCLNATLNQLSFKATWGELNRGKWILKGETTLCCCVGEERKRGTKSPHHIQCSTAITFHMNVQPDGEASGVRLGGRKWDTALDWACTICISARKCSGSSESHSEWRQRQLQCRYLWMCEPHAVRDE